MNEKRHYPDKAYCSYHIENILNSTKTSTNTSKIVTSYKSSPSKEITDRSRTSEKSKTTVKSISTPSKGSPFHYTYLSNYKPKNFTIKRYKDFIPKYKGEKETPLERKQKFLEGSINYFNRGTSITKDTNHRQQRNALGFFHRNREQRQAQVELHSASIVRPEDVISQKRYQTIKNYKNVSKEKKLNDLKSSISISKEDKKIDNFAELYKNRLKRTNNYDSENQSRRAYSQTFNDTDTNITNESIRSKYTNINGLHYSCNENNNNKNKYYSVNNPKVVQNYECNIETGISKDPEYIKKVFSKNGIHAYAFKDRSVWNKNKNYINLRLRLDDGSAYKFNLLKYKLKSKGIKIKSTKI